MYNIEFYTNRNGQSEILNFLEALRTKSKTSKDARIQYNQIVFYIDLLAKNGSNLPIKITKHLEEDIWELRPGYNRVFISIMTTSNMCFFIIFAKNRKRRQRRSFSGPRQNAMITSNKRRKNHELE